METHSQTNSESETRKSVRRKRLMSFLFEEVVPDYINYDMLDELKRYVASMSAELGEYGAFCDYYDLGDWFRKRMAIYDFDLDEFYAEYAEEVKWRSEE